MKLRKKKLFVAIVFSICLAGLARADLAGRIDDIISVSLQQKVLFSIHIVKADSGNTVYEYNARDLMIPASNMKIITSAAALKYLGPNYQYTTRIGLCGDTLVVIGSGDPLLGDEKTDTKYDRRKGWLFKDITQLLKRNNITTIEDIIVDSSIFDDQKVHPSWPKDDLNKWYACEVSGLNFNDNCIAISTKRTGSRVSVLIDPQTSFVKFDNRVKPISQGTSAVGTYRNKEPNKIVIYGKCRTSVGPFDVAIERPAAFFGFLLYENLAKAGIRTNGHLIEKTFEDQENFMLLRQYTTSLRDCLARCNKNSLGLAAEALMKTIAAHNNPDGKHGSWERGRELVSEFLLGLGIDKNQFYIDDASGLSRKNELTAYAITKVLLDVYNSDNWALYKDALAVGGIDGTISKYFADTKYKGKIIGKTGYINTVKSFSGVCSTDYGDYIFSILSNNTNAKTRGVINKIAEAIIDNEYGE
ncbi:MAG: D-alanyl-D-alanine carboxypeptidase/D-alanyl-D-alanine-endopeptidase [Sedimentisphaerales bacterium]|nr:D-alanyl-D-alanine carboxypeptidase/D-alanyl-D-alanine-endopeptidase [Sedimentisphaerales bacterium]